MLLGRVVAVAAAPSHAGGDDPGGLAQQLLHDPGAASREYRGLGVVAHHRAPFRGSALAAQPSQPGGSESNVPRSVPSIPGNATLLLCATCGSEDHTKPDFCLSSISTLRRGWPNALASVAKGGAYRR